MTDKDTIKQDINFLEYPLWSPAERNKRKIYEMTDIDGYTFKALDGVPSKVDMMILYYLLLLSQRKNYADKITVTSYQVLTGCDIRSTKEHNERLIESLDRWTGVKISFEGTFYNNITYSKMVFNIIDAFKVSEDKKKIEIRFSLDWLQKIKCSNFFKYISFTEMKHLRSPVAIRLYEILSKSFHKRDKWQISTSKIAIKIPLSTTYYSQICRQVKSSVNIINSKTALNIKVSIEKTKKNDGIITFKKIKKSMLSIMKEEQEPAIVKEDFREHKKNLLSNYTSEEIEILKEKFIKEYLPTKKILMKKYNTSGFNAVIEQSFISYLSIKNKKSPPNNED